MRASNILLPIAAASMVAGSPLNFEERDANTCTIKSIQSVVTKLSPSVATPYCQSLLKVSTKTVTKTLKPSVPSKHVVTATVHKTITSTNEDQQQSEGKRLYGFAIFDLIAIELEPTDLVDLLEIIQSCCDSVDKQQSIIIKHDPTETIKQHPLIFDIVFHQQCRKFDNDFVKQHSFSFVLVGQHAKRELFKQQPAHV
ncbi:hypothetical protein KCU99_g1355, partial [Aureobasidium melanogenum]